MTEHQVIRVIILYLSFNSDVLSLHGKHCDITATVIDILYLS